LRADAGLVVRRPPAVRDGLVPARELLLDLVVLRGLVEVVLDDLEVVALGLGLGFRALEELGDVVVAARGPEHDDLALRLSARADARGHRRDHRDGAEGDADPPRLSPHPVLLSLPRRPSVLGAV